MSALQHAKQAALVAAIVLMWGLLVLTYVLYRKDIAEARQRVASGAAVVATPCGPIEYAEVGLGPPVLVVHGAGGGYDQGLDLAAPLASRGFRVIAMSRFGYLRTPLPPDASPQAQADAHACLLDALGIRIAAIVAASAGAPSAMQFALRHPERSAALVLMVPATFVPRDEGRPPMQAPPATTFLFDTALRSDFLLWAAIPVARPILTRAILATPPQVVRDAAEEERVRVSETLRHILPVSARRLGLLNDAEVTSSLKRYELERIRTPTLVMSVEDDLFGTYENARYSASQIPHARFVGYPTGGHLWVGHNDAVLSEIEMFLKGSMDGVDKRVGERIHKGLEKHFHNVTARKNYKPNDVSAGRAYASAYVETSITSSGCMTLRKRLRPGWRTRKSTRTSRPCYRSSRSYSLDPCQARHMQRPYYQYMQPVSLDRGANDRRTR